MSGPHPFSFFLKPAFAVDTGWVRVTPGQLAMMRNIDLTCRGGGRGRYMAGAKASIAPRLYPPFLLGTRGPLAWARVHLPQERGLSPSAPISLSEV